jgi:hypothetical protein
VTKPRGESGDQRQPASGRPGQFSTQRSRKVYSDKVSVAGILRQSDCAAEEHEHPEAQLSILFRGNAPSLTHDESGKTTKTGIVAESFIFVAPGQPHLGTKDKLSYYEGVRVHPKSPEGRWCVCQHRMALTIAFSRLSPRRTWR